MTVASGAARTIHPSARSPKHSIGERPMTLPYASVAARHATSTTMFGHSPMVHDQDACHAASLKGQSG